MRNEAEVRFEVGMRVNVGITRTTARIEARLHGWDLALIRNRVLVSSTALAWECSQGRLQIGFRIGFRAGLDLSLGFELE